MGRQQVANCGPPAIFLLARQIIPIVTLFFIPCRQAHELGNLMLSRNEREHHGTMICILNFISRLYLTLLTL